MEASLDRKRAKGRGYCEVVSKYAQEIKAFAEGLEENSWQQAGVLQRLLKTKQEVLSRLDEEILAACATEEIEGEITKVEEISAKIEVALVDINHITGKGPERQESQVPINQEPESSAHVSKDDSGSNSGIEVNIPSRADKRMVKPKLPKLVLPKFNSDVTQFEAANPSLYIW